VPNWVDFNNGDTAAAGNTVKKMAGNMKPPPEISRTGGGGIYEASPCQDTRFMHPSHSLKARSCLSFPGAVALGQTHGNVLTDISVAM